MSKRRRRSRENQENTTTTSTNNNTNNRQQFNNNPFGINPNQLLSMFGNIDMNQINSMLQSMSTEGFDFNNLNLGNIQNLMSGFGRNPNQQAQQQPQQQNQQPQQQAKVQQNQNNKERKNNVELEDENIQMLVSLKKIVNADRGDFIDKIIKLYNEGAFEE